MAAIHTVLFGGTFDPVHNAHLEIARAAAGRFAHARILFVPAANPPHKEGAHAPFEDRVAMLELACAGEPRFEVSRIEQGTARSFSIHTIEKLEAGGSGPLAFLIGADAFAEIETWHRWRDVAGKVEFIVVPRPGARYRIPDGVTAHELGGLSIPVSSSEVRLKLAHGNFAVPVPAPVLDYIRARGLYH